MKGVIPAAGLGTRLLPATKSMPKEMLPILDKPVIQYVVEEAVASGVDDILIVTGRGKRAIEDHFDRSFELEHHLKLAGKEDALSQLRSISDMARIHYVRQPEPRGLGHAILCAERFVGNEPFAILLGDDIVIDDVPATKQLVEIHEKTGSSVLSVLPVEREVVSRYGVISGEPVADLPGVRRVRDIVEKPAPERAPSNLAAMGRYVLTPDIFQILRKTPPGVAGELQLTDALASLCRSDALYAHEFRGTRLDVGNLRGFLEANMTLALRRADVAGDMRALFEAVLARETRE